MFNDTAGRRDEAIRRDRAVPLALLAPGCRRNEIPDTLVCQLFIHETPIFKKFVSGVVVYCTDGCSTRDILSRFKVASTTVLSITRRPGVGSCPQVKAGKERKHAAFAMGARHHMKVRNRHVRARIHAHQETLTICFTLWPLVFGTTKIPVLALVLWELGRGY